MKPPFLGSSPPNTRLTLMLTATLTVSPNHKSNLNPPDETRSMLPYFLYRATKDKTADATPSGQDGMTSAGGAGSQ